jgi:hypothetical protein
LRARLLLTLVSALAALAVAAPAAAAAPACADAELWARPGVDRDYWIECAGSGSVAVTRGPEHGDIVTLRRTEGVVYLEYRADADAAGTDTIELALGGGQAVTATIHVVPATQNTAPTCEPIRHVQRTDGQGQAVLGIVPRCHDAEHDTLTLHAGGPGTFEHVPGEMTGGHASYIGGSLQYRTAGATGTELATYWVVDELGARSPDAPLSIAFGPDANLPVECRLSSRNPWELTLRAGAPRNFGLHCQDPEQDAFTLRLGTPPRRGAFTSFVPELVPAAEPPLWTSAHQRVDLTYVPAAPSPEPDTFTVVAETPDGPTPIRFALRSAAPAEDTPPACAHADPASAHEAIPVLIEARCTDEEGDPLEARITTPPAHGTAEPPVVAPAGFGEHRLTFRYTPAPGFGGHDRVGITFAGSDEIFFRVSVYAPPPLQFGSPPPPAPGPRTRAGRAADALGVRSVRLVRQVGVARIYAPRRALRRVGGRPALAVVCARRCRVLASTRYAHGQRIAVRPARVGVITMPWGALAARNRLAFTLRVRANGQPQRRVVVPLRLR